LIHGLRHEYQDNWKIFCRYKNSYGTIKLEQYDVSMAYVVTQFGKDFAAYALQNSDDQEKEYIDTPPTLISVKGKVIKKVKYIPKKEITERVTTTDENYNKGYIGRRKDYREPTNTEGIYKPKRKACIDSDDDDQEDEKEEKSNRYDLRKNLHQPKGNYYFTSKQEVGTGTYMPAVWRVEYEDGEKGEENYKDLEKMFGKNWMNYCITYSSQKFIPIPVGANKDSHLANWPSLIRNDAPLVHYNQKGTIDLCVLKAFASILHHVGFVIEAKLLNTKFNHKSNCFTKKDGNLLAIYTYAQNLLPKWMQCVSRMIKHTKWDTDIR